MTRPARGLGRTAAVHAALRLPVHNRNGDCDGQGPDPAAFADARDDRPFGPRRFTGKLARSPIARVEIDGVRMGRLTIRNVRREETTASVAKTVQIHPGAKISRLVLENLSHSFARGQDVPLFANEGEVDELIRL